MGEWEKRHAEAQRDYDRLIAVVAAVGAVVMSAALGFIFGVWS